MRLLLDTHVLLWAASTPERLSKRAKGLIADLDNTLYFSVASLWEIAIKSGMGRTDFNVDTRRFRRMLQANGYHELPILGDHVQQVALLPPHHKDPFDRMLVGQAQAEGITLMTSDVVLGQYGENVSIV